MILNLLTKYHHPEIFTHFLDNEITPDVFATSWFLTLFAGKIKNLEVLLSFWEEILVEKDPIFTCYFAIAFLDFNKNDLIQKKPEFIPQTISHFQINDIEALSVILKKAREMKRNMPRSVTKSLKKYNIYKLESVDYVVRTLSKNSCVSLLAREVLLRLYPQDIACKCKTGLCDWCNQEIPDPPLIIVDCRSPKEQASGILPNTALLDPQAWENVDDLNHIVEQFSNEKGVFHISLLGSQYYQNKTDEIEEEKSRIMVVNLIKTFTEKGFPYVSAVEGGYRVIHEAAYNKNLSLIAHNPQFCKVCLSSNKISDVSPSKFRERIIGNVLSHTRDSFSNKKYTSKEEKIKITNDLKSTDEKVYFDQDVKYYECRRYDKSLGSCYPDEYVLIIEEDYLILATLLNEDTGIVVEKSDLKYLKKITSSKISPKTLTFIFFGSQKKTYTLKTKKDSNACIKHVSLIYSEIKNSKI